jgi:hypothetical protein
MTLRTALASAAQDFLAQTHLWRELLTPIQTVEDEAEYPLVGSAVIESVLWVLLEGTEITATDPRLVSKGVLARVGRPSNFWIVDDTTLRLTPIPDAVYTLDVAVALKPSRTATGVPDWVYETWADALVDGAVWKLASIPNKHWSDDQRAMFHKIRFDRAIANARTRDLRQIDLHVQMRAF